ncbi:MAG TPA: hypothetical protein DIU00_02735 [Phycisphaerales bacterium]|nr:hypothetical protein [Phycisphaerales bacterium]
MAKWSLTELSSVTLFDRIDGEYYLPEYMLNQDTLSKIETVSLPQWFLVSDGNHLSISKYFSDSGRIPYFRGQDVNDFFLENAEPIKIPKKIYETPMMKRSHFHTGDVLLSIVGTIGSLSVVPDTIGDATGSCKIAILRSKGDYSPFVLAAYLISNYGQLQIKRNTRGAVQMGLILKDLSRIRVPKFSDSQQAEIEALIKNSMSVNRQSKTLYTLAQHLLESELGLDKLSFQKPVGYTARFSEVVANSRFDSDYYQIKYKQLDDIAVKLPVKKIKAISEKLETGIYSQSYSSDGKMYLRGVDINNGFIDGDFILRTNLLIANSKNTVIKDDILVTRVGSIGACALIENTHAGSFYSDNLIRIRLSDQAKEELRASYLNLLLNTTYGQMQMVRYSRGSVQQRLNQTQLAQIPVPIIKWETQLQIENLIKKYRQAKKESKSLLDQAKTRVEQLIEEAVRS